MGWTPQPRFDHHLKRWRVRLKRKTYILGTHNTPYSEIVTRFAKLYREVYGGEPREAAAPRGIEELAAAWLSDQGIGPDPKRYQFRNIKAWIEYCGHNDLREFTSINDSHISDFAMHMRKSGLKPSTIKHYADAAHRALKWAFEKGFIRTLPKKPPLRRTPYTPKDLRPAELKKLDRALSNEPKLRHIAPLVRFILATGCRPSEACNLRWDQVNAAARIVVLEADAHKTGKTTGASRTIYLTDEAMIVLQRLPTIERHVFLNHTGKPYKAGGVYSILERRGVTPYQLRHTFAQNLVDQGVSIETVGKALGHSSDVTRSYARVRDRRVLEELSSRAGALQRLTAEDSEAAAPLKPRALAPSSEGHKRGGSPKRKPRRSATG